jgi:cytochrome c oxidase subunit 3
LADHAHAHGHGESFALREQFDTAAQQKDASTLGMWVFLITEIMFFGGLFLIYTVYRVLYSEGFALASQELHVGMGFVNTLVLIGSSLTMALAVHASSVARPRATVIWLLATVLLGSVFLGVKYVEYDEKFQHHLVPGPHFQKPERVPVEHAEASEIFFSLYFGMTGLHAFHMIIGIPILIVLAVMANRNHFSRQYYTPVEMMGLYWHFVDIVWIFLFPLLYLIHPARH